MDAYDEYINKVNIINEVVKRNKYIMKDIFEELDIEQYFDILYMEVLLFNQELMNDFLEELINREKWDFLENKIQKIGVTKIFRFFSMHKDDTDEKYIKFREIVYEKFEDLIKDSTNFQDIKYVITSGKEHLAIRNSMKTLIRNLFGHDRNLLIDFFEQNSDLYDTNDYIGELLQIRDSGTNYFSSNSGSILKKLRSIDRIDKVELLKYVQKNMEAIINNYKSEYQVYDEKIFLDEVKSLIDQVPHDNQEIQDYINSINGIVSKNAMNNLRCLHYNVELMENLRGFEIDTSQFARNQDEIIANLSGGDLINYIQQSKEQEGFNKQWDSKQLVRHLYKNENSITDETTLTMLSTIISELCEQSNIKPTDITLAGKGAYSTALKIGDYIFKVGEQRASDRIINDERILRPLIRQQTNPISADEEEQKKQSEIPNLFIEVQPVVDAKWSDGLSEEEIKEELYKIYAELRDRNIFWTDVKPDNVGRLIKPNNGEFKINGQELRADNEAIQAVGQEPEKILGPGELVIIDTDYIFSKNDKKEYTEAKISYHREFEERYQREKQNILKEITNILECSDYTLEEYRKLHNELESNYKEAMGLEETQDKGNYEYDN